MSDGRSHDRYQVPPGNPEAEFVDADHLVLVNRRGITDLLAVQTGRPLLLYDAGERGTAAYIQAAKAALLRKDYRPLEAVIRAALERGQRPS